MDIMIPLPARDFDPTETAVPWRTLTDRGHAVHFATPDGRPAEADPRMLDGRGLGPWRWFLRADAGARETYRRMEACEAFEQPVAYRDLQAGDFDGLILPGGHAPGMKPYLESERLQRLVATFMAEGQTPPEPATKPRMPSPFGSAPLQDRARAYLHTNCAQCHRAGAALRSRFDVQWETPPMARGLGNADPVAGSLGVDGAKFLVPDQPAHSLIHLRAGRRDARGMPPLGSLRVDRQGVDLLNR